MDICKVHSEDFGIVDIDNYEYLMFYSYPCTSISNVGKKEGMVEGSGTASSLLWEVKRILLELKEDNCLPQTLIMENVEAIIQRKNIMQFHLWLYFLETLGYKSDFRLLNTQDYGIPQSRNRVFAISFLDSSRKFKFPTPMKSELVFKDLLDSDVDEKYYLSIENSNVRKLIRELLDNYGYDTLNRMSVTVDLPINSPKIVDVANCINARVDSGIQRFCKVNNDVLSVDKDKIHQIGNVIERKSKPRKNPNDGRVYSVCSSAPTVLCSSAPTVDCENNNDLIDLFRIRKLTPKECLRLQGVSEQDIDKMCKVNSDTQLYKQAGNSISVNVLEAIFRNLIQV